MQQVILNGQTEPCISTVLTPQYISYCKNLERKWIQWDYASSQWSMVAVASCWELLMDAHLLLCLIAFLPYGGQPSLVCSCLCFESSVFTDIHTVILEEMYEYRDHVTLWTAHTNTRRGFTLIGGEYLHHHNDFFTFNSHCGSQTKSTPRPRPQIAHCGKVHGGANTLLKPLIKYPCAIYLRRALHRA